jgi:hypothetical protein
MTEKSKANYYIITFYRLNIPENIAYSENVLLLNAFKTHYVR